MTLRHSERLSGLDDDLESNFFSDDDNPGPALVPPGPPVVLPQVPIPNAAPPAGGVAPLLRTGAYWGHRNLRTHALAAGTSEVPPPHPYQTDFGPDKVAAFFREEVDKIKRDREATKAKSKGKQKETAAPAAYGLPVGSSIIPAPSAPPLGDQSNHSHGSNAAPLVARRSARLLRKDQPTQITTGPRDPHRFNPLATPFVPGTSQQVSAQSVDEISKSWSDRATTFEDYTKNKRNAVRNNAQKPSASPLRAKSRQSGLSKSLSVPALVTGAPAGSSGDPSSRQISELTLQDDHGPRKEQGPSAGDENSVQASTLSITPNAATRDTSGTGASALKNCDLSVEVHEMKYKSIRYFDPAGIVPEVIPPAEKKSFLDNIAHAKKAAPTNPESEDPPVSRTGRRNRQRANKQKKKEEPVVLQVKQYPRIWKPSTAPGLPVATLKARRSSSSPPGRGPADVPAAIWSIDENLWAAISQFLSTEDVKKLRLVSKSFAQILAPIQLRNVVVNFGKNFFDPSMFRKYGQHMNQFGVAFEYDLHGLAYADAKVIEKEQDAWFGKFTWPTENYPRFPALQAIEDLVDNNRPLLKDALTSITSASELGLCIDSGHGWLEGPDISDMALFDMRIGKGSKVFGKTFKTEDKWASFARNELFRFGQQNTINATLKSILASPEPVESDGKEVRFLDALKVRDIGSFRCQEDQYDYDSECHTGGIATLPPVDAAVVANAQGNPQVAAILNLVNANQTPSNANANPSPAERHRRALNQARHANRKLPQWPLIFNGYNLAAEHGGHLPTIQNKTAIPSTAALVPGMLTEAQAQWLMETVWAQRAFLVAFTTAIITEKKNFSSILSLRISKLSSGLLPSLEQQEFWKTLSGLKKLEIYLKPDWRQEHVTGDRAFAQNMPTPPAKTAERFAEFLRRYITKLENLHSLSIGYVGGGEHAVGLYARNQHVLPAPIVDDPDQWLLEYNGRHAPQVTKFDHVRELRFGNCWFTPWMLKSFMEGSRDASLHSLTLDSVSMTTIHDENIEKPLTTVKDGLRCLHSSRDWALENLPEGAAWARSLDAITPGKPLQEYKYEAGLIDNDLNPMPKRSFRGHIQQITLKSCGYVKISLPKGRSSTYNQNSAVIQLDSAIDRGLQSRKARFSGFTGAANPELDVRARDRLNRMVELSDKTSRVMISADGWPWLGTLTQCIHPIEKRVLEQAWQMKFGWVDDLTRWAAVEDGQFEGGTGRFSGVIKKN